MQTALIAFLGIIVGALLAEYFRVKNRIEMFSAKIFEKRLSVYEQLYQLLNDASNISTDIIENPDYEKEERHNIWSKYVLKVAKYGDENSMYLNEDISVHCVSLLIDVESFHYIKNRSKREIEIKRFRRGIRDAKEMIRKETGLHELDNYFRTITKFKPRSDVIDYINRRRKEINAVKNK